MGCMQDTESGVVPFQRKRDELNNINPSQPPKVKNANSPASTVIGTVTVKVYLLSWRVTELSQTQVGASREIITPDWWMWTGR